MPASSVDGLVSGLNTSELIASLMSLERQPQTRLTAKRDGAQRVIGAFQDINTKLASLKSAANDLSTALSWQVLKGTSSEADFVDVLAGATAKTGNLSFTVDRLATTDSSRSTGTVSSTATILRTDPFLVSTGGSKLGFASFASSTDLPLGDHTVKVTQASTAATKTGSAIAASTTITNANNNLNIQVDGVAKTLTIANGTYTREQYAAAVNTAAAAANAAFTTTVTSSGELQLATQDEGTLATLRVTGGDGLTALGLVADGAAITGTDGIVSVDGVLTTITDARAGATMVLPSTTGSITATLAGGLRVGEITAKQVGAGDGSLASIIDAINGANSGVVATAVQVSPGEFRLQLSSTTSGADARLSMDPNAFGPLGAMTTLSQGVDSQITIGSGAGAYTVNSANNSIVDVLPGVTLTLKKADSTKTVNVDVKRDGAALADKIDKIVTAANTALKDIKGYTAYNAATKTSGVLSGETSMSAMGQRVLNAVASAVGASSLGSPGLAGVSLTREGTVAFDRTKFLDEYAKDPEAVASLFRQGGTATNAAVALDRAGDFTRAGTYAVTVTQAAERATATGAVVAGGNLTAAETITLMVGATEVSYDAAAGASLTSVADALNKLSAEGGLGVNASVESGALVLRKDAYGAAQTFSVKTSTVGAGQTNIAAAAGVYEAKAGLDVAGTIDGQLATGIGQVLSAPSTATTTKGLSLRITATAAQVAGSTDFGSYTYDPGLAQRLDSVATDAIDLVSGSLTTAITGRQSEITNLNERVADWDVRLTLREQQLRLKFSNLERMLSRMQNQSSWLSGQLSSLS